MCGAIGVHVTTLSLERYVRTGCLYPTVLRRISSYRSYHLTASFWRTLVQVEEKLEGGPQKKNLFRRIFARFCTPIFLEVCSLPRIANVWIMGLPLFSWFSFQPGAIWYFVILITVLVDLCSHSSWPFWLNGEIEANLQLLLYVLLTCPFYAFRNREIKLRMHCLCSCFRLKLDSCSCI